MLPANGHGCRRERIVEAEDALAFAQVQQSPVARLEVDEPQTPSGVNHRSSDRNQGSQRGAVHEPNLRQIEHHVWFVRFRNLDEVPANASRGRKIQFARQG
jgi:hypothetical protein